jgi:hypothetical protein
MTTSPPLPLRPEEGTQGVVCLSCRTEYVRSLGGSIFDRNSDCPACGYVGWAEAETLDRFEREHAA